MEFIDEKLENYSLVHTEEEPEILKKLNRETCLKVMRPRMISGHLQGRFLSMLSHMICPKRVLEIGTYTGYSALCIAEGMPADSELITIDINEELTPMVEKYSQLYGMQDIVKMIVGDASQIIPSLKGSFDLVFIDADKENYTLYVKQCLDLVHKGGYIVIDNVLWSGKVIAEKSHMDIETKAIDQVNKFVATCPHLQQILLPVRDGLMICRKIS
ncbi:MAG: methyltransferase [Crocinitomicaceae bacterium]|nr:methyltransferase [Crocinitomicaceae bacterium]|tara:strand:+ start:925 stop:1569 length:645 start_codon:yes stop_codon:yes gene_type:complete